MIEPFLQVRNLFASYGRLIAVRDVSFDVAKGAAVAIVGPNGAGKSTTLKAISGGVRDLTGSVTMDGVSILRMKPEMIALRGLSLVPEGRHVFPSLTVEENLRVGSFMRGDASRTINDLQNVLTYFPILRQRLSQHAGKLSGGEQQMLVLARALMTRPTIVLVDEPSLGLAPKIIDEVYDILFSLREKEGLSLLVNEQNSKRVLKFMDDIYVLREGKIQLSGKCADLRKMSSEISDAYFGHGAFGADASVVGV